MSDATRYTPMPGSGRQQGNVLIVNGTPVPAVPAGSCLLLVVGLVMWAVGMLQARTTVDGIFSDLSLEAESLDQLKTTVLAGVIVLSVLVLAVLVANVWLEASRLGSKATGPIPALQAYCTHCFHLNIANWTLLLLVALAMAGSITWLTTMSTALSATQQTGGGGGGYGASLHPTAAAAAATPIPPSASSVTATTRSAGSAPHKSVGKGAEVFELGQVWAAQSTNSICPPGCVDLGLIAQVLGLPWPCFCQVWLLADLVEQLQKVVCQLWVAVVGALLLFVATSWLYGYLAAQGVHAQRDLQLTVRQEHGGGA